MDEGKAPASSSIPSLVVFDLDECVWHPEMYQLDAIPTARDAVRGDLNGKGEGVVGVRSGGSVIEIFPGALQAFQRLLAGEYGSAVRVAAASSADTPQVWQCDQSPACYRTHLQGSACPLYKGPGQPSTHHT